MDISKKKVINQYSDPKYSWFTVKRKLLRDLKILNKISEYSFQRGFTVYLEGGRDMMLFINTVGGIEKFKEQFEVKEHHTDNTDPIRSYDRFKISPWEIENLN